jgi:hypothetical protein
MTLLHRLAAVVRWIARRDRAERDLDDELRAFAEMAALMPCAKAPLRPRPGARRRSSSGAWNRRRSASGRIGTAA